jgi:hypothetical protein
LHHGKNSQNAHRKNPPQRIKKTGTGRFKKRPAPENLAEKIFSSRRGKKNCVKKIQFSSRKKLCEKIFSSACGKKMAQKKIGVKKIFSSAWGKKIALKKNRFVREKNL